MQIKATRTEQPVDRREVGTVVRQPDLLEHADRSDLVERSLDMGVVPQLDRHAIVQAGALHTLLRIRILLFRQRNAVRAYAEVLGRMAQQRAPAAADVEEPLARLKAEFAADHIELVALGGGEIIPRHREYAHV